MLSSELAINCITSPIHSPLLVCFCHLHGTLECCTRSSYRIRVDEVKEMEEIEWFLVECCAITLTNHKRP